MRWRTEEHSYARLATWICLLYGLGLIVDSFLQIGPIIPSVAFLGGTGLAILALYTFYETSNWHDFNEMTGQQKIIPGTTVALGTAGVGTLVIMLFFVLIAVVFAFLILMAIASATEK